MRKIPTILTALILTMFYSTSVSAQWTANEPLAADEVQPVFRGGGEATFADWVRKQVMFSSDGRFLTKVDVVIVSFVVDQKGKIRDLSAESMEDIELKNEVLKLIRKAPNMTPGTRNGKPAEFRLTAEIIFDPNLEDENSPLENKRSEPAEVEILPCFLKKTDKNRQINDPEFREWMFKKIDNETYNYVVSGDVKTLISFILNKEGYIEYVNIKETSSWNLTTILIKILYNCPQWYSPAYVDGKPVRLFFDLPITLRGER